MLDAWTASPARFREDANAEEELARGSYRDRVVIELAQNAADAAGAGDRAGLTGRLLLRLAGDVLTAANTGAPLDAAGVEGLSTLRSSVKRDQRGAATVGRFGVGFAAVLAVTDTPAVLSHSGGVCWSRDEATALLVERSAGVPGLRDELDHRGMAVPVLRLPLPVDPARLTTEIPEGYDTAVVLPLRDANASALARDALARVDDALLLALPMLGEVVVEIDDATRVLRAERAGDDLVVSEGTRRNRWRTASRNGQLAAHLLAGRPLEEPDRWSVTVAVPVGADGGPEPLPPSVPRVVHAPTPTDERTDLPLLVLASFPLDSTRRRVDPSPLTDFVAEQVGLVAADLATHLAGPRVLDLVPGPLGKSPLDAELGRAVRDALAGTPLLPTADEEALLRPDQAVLPEGLPSGSAAGLSRFVDGVVAAGWWRREPLRRLGVRLVDLAELVDRFGELQLAPEDWRDVYETLNGADLEALGRLPVPLADGRLVHGPRGAIVPAADVPVESLLALGLRVVHPAAAHPLLARLGAQEGTAVAVLRHPSVAGAVENLEASPESGQLVDAVLRLVAASGLDVTELPWLARLTLPSAVGDDVAAGDLWLPESPVLPLLGTDAGRYVVSDSVLEAWPPSVLEAVGVRNGFGLVLDADVTLDEESWHDLDDEDAWVDSVLDMVPSAELPPTLDQLIAVRDLDLVRHDAWPQALALLVDDIGTRPALVDPAFVQLPDGRRVEVPSYTVWWLRRHARLDGRPVGQLCAADAEGVVRKVLTPVPASLDPVVARALGLARTLADLVAAPALLLDRLADPGVSLDVTELAVVYRALSAAKPEAVSYSPPERVRVPDGAGTAVVDAADALVADGPHWLQLGLAAALPGSADLADILDLDLASEVYQATPSAGGVHAAVPSVVNQLLPDAPQRYVEHDDLVVAGRSVEWWVDDGGLVHAATLDGLARGLAWVCDRWELRLLLAEALRAPEVVSFLVAERSYDP